MDIPRLHPDTINAVKEKTDILDVIADYVVLRKRGKSHLGLCPFHSEKTPSFSVNQEKQVYHCFGCGAGGNAFTFLMELEKHSFTDVVLELAQRYQIPVQTLQPEQRQQLERQLSLQEQLRDIMAIASSFYQHALYQPEGATALEYLKTQRNLSETTIQKFQLGYAPSGWETLYRYLVDVKRYPVSLVVEAGLIQPSQSRENSYYDRFRNRLMIPIRDVQGRVIAFGGRSLTDEEPKYLNSPETPLFDKSKTLFAIEQAYRHIGEQDEVIIVEGYFDAIALHQNNINNTVACLGTALTNAHLNKILRYTPSKRVILNLDADKAGIQATERAIETISHLIYSGQIQLRILNLPQGKDAAEYLHSDTDAVTKYSEQLKTAPIWLDWQLQQILKNRDLKQGDQFQQVSSQMVKILNKLTNFDLQSHYIGYCAQLLSQDNPQLLRLYSEKLRIQLKKPLTEKNLVFSPAPEQGVLEEAEFTLLRLYLYYLEYRFLISDALSNKDLVFSIREYRDLWSRIVELEQDATPPEYILSNLQDYYLTQGEIPLKINRLFIVDEKTLWEDEYRIPQLIEHAIAAIEEINLIKQRSYYAKKMQHIDHVSQQKEMTNLYRELIKITQKLVQVTKIRSTNDKPEE